MPQAENGVIDECFYALRHYGFFVFPRVTPRGVKLEWPILDTTNYSGIAWKANTGAMRVGKSFIRFGIPGLPDIQGWRFSDGVRIAIEAKTDSGKLNPNQQRHLDMARETGCIAFVARGYDDVERELKAWGLKRR